MTKTFVSLSMAAATAMLLTFNATAQTTDETMKDVAALQHQWDIAKYQTPALEQEDAFKKLADQAHAVSEKYKGRAEPLVWEGIILSTYAGAKGGLGALSVVKEARARLEAAEKINPAALDGSVYTSLGSLYYQVPGWPVGFGDDKKAREYLEKAVATNPTGIDANYFYGDFLLEEGDYQKALDVLNKAFNAPPRPGREIADAGRRKEIEADIKKAQGKL